MNPKDLVELILGILGLVGIVYQLAQVERHIYDEIDKLKDSIIARISVNENKFDIHIQDYVNRKETVQYLLGSLDQKIEHKFGRLYGDFKEMQRFLEKHFYFRIRGGGDE
jgi:hypothetical protein